MLDCKHGKKTNERLRRHRSLSWPAGEVDIANVSGINIPLRGQERSCLEKLHDHIKLGTTLHASLTKCVLACSLVLCFDNFRVEDKYNSSLHWRTYVSQNFFGTTVDWLQRNYRVVDPPPPVFIISYVGLIFHKLIVKWRPLIFPLVVNRKIRAWCR